MMTEQNYDIEKELKSKGAYHFEGTWYGGPYVPVERLSPPITPRENMLRYYRGEDYKWLPDCVCDQIEITPHCNLDVDAADYDGGYDAFGVKWIPVRDHMLPAFVEPGFKLWEDISDWRNSSFPDPDTWQWKKYGGRYCEAYKEDDRLRRGVLLSGYFERLIANLGFEDAAVAMISDPEEVTAFFDELTEFNKKIMNHYIDDFGCEIIMIHDDWSSQRAPFFSLNTAMEILVPQVKKLVDAAHERSVLFTFHSCGNGLDLIPAIKATGADAWQLQGTAVDIDAAYEACGDELILEWDPPIPEGIYGAELEEYIREIMEKYCTKHKSLVSVFDTEENRWPETRRLKYKVSRELAERNKSC